MNKLLPATLLSLISLYVIGYLIQSITLKNYGIQELNLLTLQYIEIGITFLILTLVITIIPVGCFLAYKLVRKRYNLPNYYLGFLGSFLNTYHLFLMVTFFALFITKQEWDKIITFTTSNTSFKSVFFCYLILALPAVVILPVIERKVLNRVSKKAYSLITEPFRLIGIISAITFDCILYKSFPWFKIFLYQSAIYFSSSIAFLITVFLVFFYFRKFQGEMTRYLIPILGAVGSIIVLYICINAYVVGVVRHIPFNRGGNLPISKAYLTIDKSLLDSVPFRDNISRENVIGPFYILETTQDYIYVTKEIGEKWFNDWPITFSIKRSFINSITYERISTDGPRE